MSYFAYILKSEYDGTYYYGSTQNIRERLINHNKGNALTQKAEGLGKFILPKNSNLRMKL